ncbi:MAG: ABC transporter permease, partial [Clostridiaceae bacterium]|nr:ABC transporter permease [Clostridiaceae bacterium]
SLDLGIRAGIIAVIAGLFLGIMAAYFKNRIVDRLTLVIVMTGMSIPGFVIGTVFQYFICYRLSEYIYSVSGSNYRLFPVTGWQGFRYTIVPSLSLAVGAMGMIARMMRTGMIEVLSSNYIIAAKARGLSAWEVLTRHAVRNAVLPVVSILGPLMTSIVLGAFVIENIFSIPGIGQYFVSSIQAKDYTMILGLSVFTVLVVVVLNTLTDILYAVIDPRVRILKEQ